MIVRAGTEITIVLGSTDRVLAWRATTVCERVGSTLARSLEPLQIRSCALDVPSWLSSAAVGAILTNTYEYVGTWVVVPQADYAQPEHVALVLAGLVWQATGFYPAEIAVTKIGASDTGSTAPTPEPPAIDLSGIGSFFTNLANSSTLILVALLALAAFVVVTIARSPEGRRAALRVLG